MSPAITFIAIMFGAFLTLGILFLIVSVLRAWEEPILDDVQMTDDDLPPFMRRVEDDTDFSSYDLITTFPRLPNGTRISTPESRHLANPKNLNLN